MYTNKVWERRIRMEAASQGIENTIQAVEEGLAVKFPRGGSPTESRAMMRDILRRMRRHGP